VPLVEGEDVLDYVPALDSTCIRAVTLCLDSLVEYLNRARALAAALPLLLGAACNGNPVAPDKSLIVLTASPLTLRAEDASVLLARAEEQTGELVVDGTIITFDTDLGTLAQNRDGGMATSIARTKQGVARLYLVATDRPGAARVTASSGKNKSNTITITFVVTVGTIGLAASTRSLPCGGGSVDLVAAVADKNGAPIPQQTVLFDTSDGRLERAAGTTDATGQIENRLTTSKTATVSARVPGSAAAPGTVAITVALCPGT
jgi:hypothetical protein